MDAIGNLKKSPKVFEHQPLPTDGTDGMAAIDPYVLLQDGIEDFLGELKREVFDKYDMNDRGRGQRSGGQGEAVHRRKRAVFQGL